MRSFLFLAASFSHISADLPVGPVAPVVIPKQPAPYWSWDRIPLSFHGAVKDREFTDAEVAHLAKFQMFTPEKWYTPCGSKGPTQSGPSCDIEAKTENLFRRVRALNPNQTTILYWNTMFDFSFYNAHQRMLDLEAAGTPAFLRDETGEVMYLCNDGNVYCNITTFDWTQPAVRKLWIDTVLNATATGLVDGIFADHATGNGVIIGNTEKNGQAPNQLCNGKDSGRRCFNFTDSFRDEFNSWHMWGTNYTQDVLSKTTGGPVIQGPVARAGHEVNPCDFDSVRGAQQVYNKYSNSTLLVVEAVKCQPSEKCLAAYLAAVQPYTYLHCFQNGDNIVAKTHFPEMDYHLGAPDGDAQETKPGSQIWTRSFASGTIVTWNQKKKTGRIQWAGQPPAPPPAPVVPASCGTLLVDMGLGKPDLGHQKVTASAAECCGRCQNMSGCEAWTWHTDQGNTCHFHTAKATRSPKDADSGIYSAFLPNSYIV